MPDPHGTFRSYAQLCGIATALDVVGERWALLIVRDLMFGPLRFSDLVEGLPGVGTNTLALRLKQLEFTGVIRRRLLPLPERATVYELTAYGHELESILMALGRWGARSMERLPDKRASRSRWLVAGMLAFHNEAHRVATPTIWCLRLSDGPFTLRADGVEVTISAGEPDRLDHTVAVADGDLHLMLTGRLTPAEAIASGVCTVSDRDALPRLLDLFVFPTMTAPAPA